MNPEELTVKSRLRRIGAPDATREPLETIHAVEDNKVLGFIYEPEFINGDGPLLVEVVTDVWLDPELMPEDQENFPVEA